jgi:hypothetical protein
MTLAEWKEAGEVMAERREVEKGMYEGAEADTFPELSAGIVPATERAFTPVGNGAEPF